MFVLTLETNVRPELDDRICLDFLPDAYIKVCVHPGISNNEKSYLTPGSRQRNKQWRHTTERIFFALSGDKEVRRSAARRWYFRHFSWDCVFRCRSFEAWQARLQLVHEDDALRTMMASICTKRKLKSVPTFQLCFESQYTAVACTRLSQVKIGPCQLPQVLHRPSVVLVLCG